MILNGNQRGGARDLALHLMKPENEHIDVHEIRGFVADDIMGALREAEAVSRGTKCRQFLYSLSLSPPERETVPVGAFEAAIDRVEEKLGLAGHPRVVVFHEKQGRRHAHCVWSRIDADSMTAVRMSHDRPKLGDVSRELYFEHGWKMPEGLIDPALRSPLSFDRKEWFQAKRSGADPRDIKAALQQCWAASDSGRALASALAVRGYYLARGDRRAVVALNFQGGTYALARWTGVKAKDVAARLASLALPSIDEQRKRIADLRQAKLSGLAAEASNDFERAARVLEGRRVQIVERHRAEREQLRAQHAERAREETRQRAARFRKGLLAIWDRVTGQHQRIRKENELNAKECGLRDATAAQALIASQLKERQRLQDELRQERRMHVRDLARLARELGGRALDEESESGNRSGLRRRQRSGPELG